jgi:hypothetical protein
MIGKEKKNRKRILSPWKPPPPLIDLTSTKKTKKAYRNDNISDPPNTDKGSGKGNIMEGKAETDHLNLFNLNKSVGKENLVNQAVPCRSRLYR